MPRNFVLMPTGELVDRLCGEHSVPGCPRHDIECVWRDEKNDIAVAVYRVQPDNNRGSSISYHIELMKGWGWNDRENPRFVQQIICAPATYSIMLTIVLCQLKRCYTYAFGPMVGFMDTLRLAYEDLYGIVTPSSMAEAMKRRQDDMAAISNQVENEVCCKL